MTIIILALLGSFAVSLLLTPLARFFGQRVGLVDRPDGYRKLHAQPIPVSGGYAIFVAFFVPLGLVLMLGIAPLAELMRYEGRRVVVLAITAFFVLAMGSWDDIKNLSPRYKILFQLIAAIAAFYGGFAITRLSNPFGAEAIELGRLALPITILWFLSCMNAINLVDGLDGLASGVSLFACLTMALVGLLSDNLVGCFLSALLSGAILGFLIFNFNPASIFLGDGGSMLLGYLIAAMSLMGSLKAGTAVALVTPVVALGLPAFDTALAIMRRWARGLPITSADGRHIHHILLSVGLSQKHTVLIMYSVCVALGAIALLLTAGNNEVALFFLGILVILAFVFVRVFNILRFKDIGDRIAHDFLDRRRSNAASVAVEQALVLAKRSNTVEELWATQAEAFKGLGLSAAELRLRRVPWDGLTLDWGADGEEPDDTGYASDQDRYDDRWNLELQLVDESRVVGYLTLSCLGEALPVPEVMSLAHRLRSALSRRLIELSDMPTRPDSVASESTNRPEPSGC